MEPIGAIAISLALDPQSQTAAPMQLRLLFRPVQHLKQHLRNVVAAIVVVFVRHQGVRTWEVNGILPTPGGRVHQRRSVCIWSPRRLPA